MLSKKISILFYSIIILSSYQAFGQVDFQFNQYMHNLYTINPAYGGTNDALEITSSIRKQWFGIEGSPFSQLLSAHSPLRNKNVGLGLLIANDKIGVHNNFQFSTSYSYKIKIDRHKRISFGLQGGFYQSLSNYAEIVESLSNTSDPVFNENLPQSINANFGTGIFFYSRDFYVGLSMQNIETNRPFNKAQSFLTAGKTFTLTNNAVVQPGILARINANSDLTVDIFSNLVLNDVLWLGVSYRTLSSINFLTQFQVTPQIRFGYSYGTPTSRMGNIGASTHEIMLKYRFSFYRARYITPRYF